MRFLVSNDQAYHGEEVSDVLVTGLLIIRDCDDILHIGM
jgi:hypothetical protein